jgi:hypothetical protein
MKRLTLTIEGCADCPYARFDHGSQEKDAGWDCSLANQRITDEGDRWDFTDDALGEELPMTLETIMRATGLHLYPDWCPLPETE